MATNKQALLRYKTIDQCLQNRLRKWTLEDLIDAVAEALYDYEGKETGIGKRTIQQDIQVMRSDTLGYNAPIIVLQKKYYTYEDKQYTIFNAQMNPADIEKLQETVQLLRQFSAVGYFNGMTELITKLENNVAQTLLGQHNLVQFESNPLLKGLDYINPLYQAISKQQCVNIAYKSFKATEAIEQVYFPYLLKEYRNRWFVIAKAKGKPTLLTLALDRIENFSTNNSEKFMPQKGLNFDTYYNDTLGVTKTEKDKAVAVIFSAHPAHAPYIITKPIHNSQEILKQDNSGTTFKIVVVLNFELERELLGFGEHIIVQSPRILVQRMKKRLAAMQAQYQKSRE